MIERIRRLAQRSGSDRLDAVAIAGVGVLFVLETFLNAHVRGPVGVNLLFAAGMTLPLLWRRACPLAVMCVIAAAAITTTAVATSATDVMSVFLAVLLASFSVGAYATDARGRIGLGVTVAAVLAIDLIHGVSGIGDITFPIAFFTSAWAAGRLLASRRSVTGELRARADRLQRERAELAQCAVEEERARVARELHDVVAHSVSVMVVQAGAARRVLDRSPQESLAALGAVEATGREALAELRRMLGMLRPEGTPAELAPQPTLATDLQGLVDRARNAGLPVEVQVTGTPKPLPVGVDLAAYRIVQEALTNTLKHAGPAHAKITVAWGENDVELEVRDTGSGAGPRNGSLTGAGLGLVGMRERVALLGGTLDVGPARGGGFRVRAHLPQEPPAP